jgi:hypothetical protein
MIDHAPADLWIVPLGTKCFEDPSLGALAVGMKVDVYFRYDKPRQ